jgi:dihydrofolate synthase/folylpolyglutamate synthase
VTPLPSERAAAVEDLASLTRGAGVETSVHADLFYAASAARDWAGESDRRAVVIAGSVVLAGEMIGLAEEEGWKS